MIELKNPTSKDDTIAVEKVLDELRSKGAMTVNASEEQAEEEKDKAKTKKNKNRKKMTIVEN